MPYTKMLPKNNCPHAAADAVSWPFCAWRTAAASGVLKPSRAGRRESSSSPAAKLSAFHSVLCQLKVYWRTVSSMNAAPKTPASTQSAHWCCTAYIDQRPYGLWLRCQ